jgi:uroporphyrinogen decarboxylase
MNKRELVLSLLDKETPQTYIPAGFFLHFDPTFHHGQAAVKKHLEFFRYTGMDFVKVQYEHMFPRMPEITKPSDWTRVPRFDMEFFEQPLKVIAGLTKEVKPEALIIVTLYSPFMVAGQVNSQETITRHILENPEKAKIGIEIAADAMMQFVKACIKLGVDGFYTSTQGAESFRFPSIEPFNECIKPYDLMIMKETNASCIFNILHVCDYHGGYSDLSPFVDYPGEIVNCSMRLENRKLTGHEISNLFDRPFMGGMERKGIIATGSHEEIQKAALKNLKQAPEKYILAADCTVPGETPWDNLRVAINTAHNFKG